MEVGLCDLDAVCMYVCMCVCPPLSTFKCLNQSLWSLVCTSWHMSHFSSVLYKSLLSACVSVCVSHIVATQRLSEKFTAVTNTHATIEDLLDVSSYMRSVSYQGK
jgi:hypothetical protein